MEEASPKDARAATNEARPAWPEISVDAQVFRDALVAKSSGGTAELSSWHL